MERRVFPMNLLRFLTRKPQLLWPSLNVESSGLSHLWFTVCLLVSALFLAGCATSTQPQSPPVPNLYEVKQELSRYVSSGRYHAEVNAVYTRASAYLLAQARGETNL